MTLISSSSPSTSPTKLCDLSPRRSSSSRPKKYVAVIYLLPTSLIVLLVTLISTRSLLLTCSSCIDQTTIIDMNHINVSHNVHENERNLTNANNDNKHSHQNDNIYEKLGGDDTDTELLPPIDFAIVGFPKTGTSTLLNALRRHPEVAMPAREFCQIHQEGGDKSWHDWVRKQKPKWIQRSNTKTKTMSIHNKKFGIKCPAMVRLPSATENLVKISNNTHLIIGLRHPILWFQSFYNYRVWEHFEYNMTRMEIIPYPRELTSGGKHWRVVSTALARFEDYLQQLDKVDLTPDEMNEMLYGEKFWPRRLVPNTYKIFMYVDEQLNDKDTIRRVQLQRDLQEFLGLQTPILDFGTIKSNANTDYYKEYIDICDSQYSSIRSELLEQAKKTSAWIRNKFIESEDVVVSDKEHFLSILSSWNEDPCEAIGSKKNVKRKKQPNTETKSDA